jgi:D-aminoacyl-tRNA deacylase
MKIVIQRVKQCSVSVNGTSMSRINKGVLIFLGVDKNDGFPEADYCAEKCASLRIFPDDSGKMNLSTTDINGEALVVSQFTLFGNCTKGNRPNFTQAAGFDKGKEIYEYFISRIRKHIPKVETGTFGAMMEVELINDGPVTIILERKNVYDNNDDFDKCQA